jgi:toxin-antitoxin system PIN domain toxin
MRALLDVNVLIALLDAAHVHHDLATAWLGRELAQGWASCPITQIGCVRIMSQPAYPGDLKAGEIASRLGDACKHGAHAFWSGSVDLLGSSTIRWSHVLGHRQVTDTYLLALAVKHGGRFVSFDRRIGLKAVIGARPEHLVVIED